MKITPYNHLCYSLNVYPGTSLEKKVQILSQKVPIIRENLCLDSDTPFALGLWLDANTADELTNTSKLAEFKNFLEENNYYVFTVNAFPFGEFHGQEVKEQVYLPDWTSEERLVYTCNVADILAELLPDGIIGSISTVPGSYKSFINSDSQVDAIYSNLRKAAAHLKKIEDETGKRIVLSLEMEPDCLWESVDEFVGFYNKYFKEDSSLKEYIGVCYDTCHQELISDQPGQGIQKLIDNDIIISKIQISAALKAESIQSKITLENYFSDDVYLHQTREISSDLYHSFFDLPAAFENAVRSNPWTVHFHLPIYMDRLFGGLSVVKDELYEVIKILDRNPEICSNIEIETYTYSVLPESLKQESLEKSIAREYQWVLNQLGK